MKKRIKSILQDADTRTQNHFSIMHPRPSRNIPEQEKEDWSPSSRHSLMSLPKSFSYDVVKQAMISEMAYHNLTILATIDPLFATALGNHRLKRQVTAIIMQNCIDILGTDIDCYSKFAEMKKYFPEFNGDLHATFDGTCNNLRVKSAGATPIPLKRLLPAAYDSLPSVPRQTSRFRRPLKSARDISNVLSGVQAKSSIFTMLGVTWGQFLDHDIDLTCAGNFVSGTSCTNVCNRQPGSECFPIQVDSNDSALNCRKCIPFARSCPVCVRNNFYPHKPGPREQINQITSYIDAGLVYGGPDLNEEQYWMNLFDMSTGKLRIQRTRWGTDLLPDAVKGKKKCDNGCFVAGDVRANEATVLTALHIIFVREHNRLVDNLKIINPHWSATKLYLEARKIVAAEIQHITYEEFVPLVLGIKLYRYFYNDKFIATATNVFATASFRFGHSTLADDFLRLDSNYSNDSMPAVPMHQGFFDTSHLRQEGGLDSFIRGMAVQEAAKNSENFANSVRNRLFENRNSDCGLDLLALNTQRGRDHGLPSYNMWREFVKLYCGVTTGRANTFDDLNKDIPPEALSKLRSIYDHVDDIDLFPGAMSEKLHKRGITGPTFFCLNKIQFINLRYGDRLWYENAGVFSKMQKREIRKVTLAKVLCDNGDNIDRIPLEVMKFKSGPLSLEDCSNIDGINLNEWVDIVI